jgi:hypothetical protein
VLFVRNEFGFVSGLVQHAFDLRHQVAVLENFPEVKTFFSQDAFEPAQRI